MLFEAWDDTLRNTCGHYYAVPQDRQRIVAGHFVRQRLSGFDVADFSCDVRKIYRTMQDVRQDDAEYFYLLVQISGRTKAEQDGERANLSPGNLYLLDSTKPATLQFDGEKSHCISVHLPRGTLLAEAAESLRAGLCIDQSSAFARRLREYVSANASYTRGNSKPNSSYMLDLARMAFATKKEAEQILFRRASQTLRYEYAIREIETHVACPELSLAWLSYRIGVSPRQLERDFRAHEDSFVTRLRDKRLKLVRESIDIALRGGQDVRITDIAFTAGFRDLSNFNRAFRNRYNHTPRDYVALMGIMGDCSGAQKMAS